MVKEVKEFFVTFLLTGALTSITKTIVAPTDRIKLILQNQDSAYQILTGERKRYTGIMDCIVRIPKEQGFFSFWRGNWVNIIRSFPTQAFNFAFHDLYKHLLDSFIDAKKYAVCTKFLSGGLAGSTGLFLVYPLDFCQTKLASDFGSDASVKKGHVKREYNGLTNCLSTVYKREGILGYYKGVLVEISAVFIYRSLYFGLYDTIQERAHFKKSFMTNALLAFVTTSFSSLIAYPLDTVGRRLMLDSARAPQYKLFKGNLDAFRSIYRQGGIRNFYRGILINSIRTCSSAMVLVLYDEVSKKTDWKTKIK